jgi:plastocyanin
MLFIHSFHAGVRRAAAGGPGSSGRIKQRRGLRIKPSRIQRALFVFLAALTSAFLPLVPFTSAAHDNDDQGDKHKTYTVLVAAEDVDVGASLSAFFPATLRIHVGDTVHWQRNANEVHTVTFLAGTTLPPFNVPAPDGLPSPLMHNPLISFPVAPADGRYDGTSFATSGIFGPDEDIYEVESFNLTFTRRGTFNYVCVVHGARMSGQIIVVDDDEHVPPPREVEEQARRSIAAGMAEVPAALEIAGEAVPPPTLNEDGTTTYYVLAGYSVGPNLDLLHFFPDDLTVQPGDTVEWIFGMQNMPVPHTITFLNGAEPPADIIPVPQDDGPPLLVLSAEFYYPHNADQPLTRDGVYHSGRLQWTGGDPPTFSFTIGSISGEMPYRCLVHDDSGMLARLTVVP